jgi:altronate hydrolase
MTAPQTLKLDPADDLIVALTDLPAGSVQHDGRLYQLPGGVRAKHKFAARDLAARERVKMYGIVIGTAKCPIKAGDLITQANLTHATDEVTLHSRPRPWTAPDVSAFEGRTFDGYFRGDGRVGTANYWLVIPMVFCENRNLQVMREALLDELGYRQIGPYQRQARQLIEAFKRGDSPEAIAAMDLLPASADAHQRRILPGVDGVKFLMHSMGCGGTRQDAAGLAAILAAYVNHPNVAGATIMSLGCQNAEVRLLTDRLAQLNPKFDKPLLIFDQQKTGSEAKLLSEAIKHTFAGMVAANDLRRSPAPLSKLCVGVKCGGSDGFSGISANPAVGHTADLLAALGGQVLLAEFPELFGTEQELVDRCVDRRLAGKFLDLMADYQRRAKAVGSGMENNPSPGNIADGLITDAMKSAGAVRKGGSSPVTDVLDYADPATRPGLNLVCSPGNDVESTTAMTGAGANVILFTTGLGTPTGNPICPTLKISTNTALTQRMGDIIDLDAGPIIRGEKSIEEVGRVILELVIETASGRYTPHAVRLGQDDFIPWKRGVSL